jgi:hypothetical protein
MRLAGQNDLPGLFIAKSARDRSIFVASMPVKSKSFVQHPG